MNAGETPLMHAARSGSVEAVNAAVAGGEREREKLERPDGAALGGSRRARTVVETLIEGGADIRQRSNAGTTPFMFAVRKGDMASVKAFLAAGADVNEKRVDLRRRCSSPSSTATKISSTCCSTRAPIRTPKAARPPVGAGHEGASHKITLKTPSYREQLRDVGTEGGNGANNSWGRPLQAAMHVANWHISDEFVSVNVDRMRIIKSLIKHGADVNGRNSDMEPRWSGARYRRRLVGLTAFLSAAKQADIEVMRLLLQRRRPEDQHAAQHHPADAGGGHRVGVESGSRQRGASARRGQDAGGRAGADVNFVADTGETAMHAAAYRGANSVVQYLFDKGAKLDVVDKSGRTPLQVAEGVEYGNSFAAKPQTAVLLRKLGAKEIPCPGLCPNMIPEEALPPEEPVR